MSTRLERRTSPCSAVSIDFWPMMSAEETAGGGAAFPLAAMNLLDRILALRNRHQLGEISLHGTYYIATGRLENEMDRLLAHTFRLSANRRLAKHLRNERPHLLTFLHCPGAEATNNAAEQAIRPAVIARQTWGRQPQSDVRPLLRRSSVFQRLQAAVL
jgi:hypothetical protein